MIKKLITIFLVLALILQTAALAADGDSPFFGEWSGIEHHAITVYHAVVHYVEISKYGASTYAVFYLSYGGKLSKSEIYSGAWKVVDDHIQVPTSGITYVDFYLNDDGTLKTKDPKVTYTKLP